MVFKESESPKVLKLKSTTALPEKRGVFGHRIRRGATERPFLGRVIREIEVEDNTRMEFLPSGRASLEKELDIIKHPTVDPRTGEGHVYVQTFTLDAGDDPMGSKFLRAFESATTQHPKVKYGFLADHIYWVRGLFKKDGKPEKVRQMLTYLNNGNVNVAVTNSFNFLGIHENPFHRNHQKIASDGTRAVVTTANIGEHHTKWLDAGIYFEGPVANVIDGIATNTFAYAKRWERVYSTEDPFEYVREYGLLPRYTDVYGSIVRNADDRGQKITVKSKQGQVIEILTDSFYKPYQEATNAAFDMVEHAAPGSTVDVFTPYPGLFTLTGKMLAARQNGVTINLHIPSENDYMLYNSQSAPLILRPFISMQQKGWKAKLKAAGIHVFEFGDDNESGGMAHVKAVRVTNPDGAGKLWFGSSNLNKGLLAGSNREIAVVLSDEGILKDFDTFTKQYREQAAQLF